MAWTFDWEKIIKYYIKHFTDYLNTKFYNFREIIPQNFVLQRFWIFIEQTRRGEFSDVIQVSVGFALLMTPNISTFIRQS